jgi:tRNA pseudouridine32 synthase/23S rRNA pseudouridine746 synthase
LGLPIQYDQIYPVLTPYQKYDLDFSKPLQLLAKEIRFHDPITLEDRSFVSQRALSVVCDTN